MNWIDFGIRMTGLRTNGLVAIGSTMFIMMGGLIAGDGSQGRVAAYVVLVIGFLGGMNTAATLWCTAAAQYRSGWWCLEVICRASAW